MSRMWSKLALVRRGAGWLLAGAILFFLARTLYASWDQIAASGFAFQFNLPLLAVSLILLVIGRSFAVEAWRRILWALGDSVSFRTAFRAWFLSNLARYIPGNIWQVATLMVIVEPYGVSKTNVVLSQVVYTTIALSISGLFGLGLLPLPGDILPYLGLALVVLILVLAQPRVFDLLIGLSQQIICYVRARWRAHTAAAAPKHRPELGCARGLLPPLGSCLMWSCNGIAFFLFIRSTTEIPFDRLPVFVAMNAAAYFIGYVSFVTPSGLGFREGALALFLSAFFPTPVAVALAFAARLWSTAGEFLGVGIALLPDKSQPTPAPSK